MHGPMNVKFGINAGVAIFVFLQWLSWKCKYNAA